MSFLKNLFGGGEQQKSQPSTNQPETQLGGRTLQDLFYTDFKSTEVGKHELVVKEFGIFDQVEVVTWQDYPENKNIIFSGKYSKQNLQDVAKLVNSLAFFYGKDTQNNGNFNSEDEDCLLDKGPSDLKGWWAGRLWDSELSKSKGLPAVILSRDEQVLSLQLSF